MPPFSSEAYVRERLTLLYQDLLDELEADGQFAARDAILAKFPYPQTPADEADRPHGHPTDPA